MAKMYQVPVNNALQYTLDSAYTAGGTSLVLSASVAGVVQAPGVCVVDRVDSSGNSTSTKRTYYSFTGVSGVNLTGLATVDGTDQSHSVGAIVEFIPDVIQQQAVYDTFNVEHYSTNGFHKSLASLSAFQTNNGVVASMVSGNGLNFFTGVFASLASGNLLNFNSAAFGSQVSVNRLSIGTELNASAASLTGVNDLVPAWFFGGTVSAASLGLGFPVDAPRSGTIQFVSAILRYGSSGASLFLDLTKNGISLLNANASQSVLMIPINGTFASTASISSPIFTAGDVFNFSVVGSGSMGQDLVVKFLAR